jgi:four helix bundle protein
VRERNGCGTTLFESWATPRREGSGSEHATEFKQFLNIARRSLFEDASMLLVFERMKFVETDEVTTLLETCDHLSRKITSFSRTL